MKSALKLTSVTNIALSAIIAKAIRFIPFVDPTGEPTGVVTAASTLAAFLLINDNDPWGTFFLSSSV